MLCLCKSTQKAIHRDEAVGGAFREMISKPLMCSENMGFHSSGFLRAITVIQLLMKTAMETVLTLSSSSFVCKNNHGVPTYLHREFLNAVGIG